MYFYCCVIFKSRHSAVHLVYMTESLRSYSVLSNALKVFKCQLRINIFYYEEYDFNCLACNKCCPIFCTFSPFSSITVTNCTPVSIALDFLMTLDFATFMFLFSCFIIAGHVQFYVQCMSDSSDWSGCHRNRLGPE
jgi:hypothetical protein